MLFVCSSAFSKSLEVDFGIRTIPQIKGLETTYSATREGDEWTISVNVRNNGRKAAVFKLALYAEPHIIATQYLMPGINYNGNPYGNNMPQGWEHNGEPWVFAYDRGSIPSCTISENAENVFALFASDADTASLVSSCSMEKLPDGSFRHIIYWPVTEAPLSYTDKLKFSERYDTYLTLSPGEHFHATAVACTGDVNIPAYGFAEVFPVAWRRLRHEVPSKRSLREIMRLDKTYQDWCRRQDEFGYWYGGIIDDEVFRTGYNHDGEYSLEEYDVHPEWNHWRTDEVEKSKHLAPGEYLYGHGGNAGFATQTFQMARLSVEYGLRNGSPDDLDFGLKSLRSWIRTRQYPSGLFRSSVIRYPDPSNPSTIGWQISELARVSILLRKYGLDASEFVSAGSRLVEAILVGIDEDGNVGSRWDGDDGHVLQRGGDAAGFVLMGLARWWQLTGDESLIPVLDKSLRYYYSKDIDHFRCAGGAIDCASVDREGIHPFISAAMILYKGTGNPRYLDYVYKGVWYLLSWLYLQNPIYAPGTDLFELDWKPCGATIVGAEHPGLDEYACVLIPELMILSHVDGNPMWRDIAALIMRNASQCIADESFHYWQGLERPIGSKNEAIFPCRWSKYRVGEKKRGSINNHLVAWPGTYRLASIYELSAEDLLWLEEAVRPDC